jgi:hypothetical protein
MIHGSIKHSMLEEPYTKLKSFNTFYEYMSISEKYVYIFKKFTLDILKMFKNSREL